MNKRGWFKKSVLVLALWGLALGVTTAAYARSGGGIDLKNRGDNYGMVAQIERDSGQIFTGMMFIVDNSNPLSKNSTGNGSFARPFDTVDYAIGRASASAQSGSPAANNGSLILVLSGHAKDLSTADAIDADLAGITIWGVGQGADRPTFTYTAAAGEFTIGANSVTIGNLRFIASVTDVLKGINIEVGNSYPKIVNCEFSVDSGGTDEFTVTIYLEGSQTGALIEGNTIDNGAGGAVQAIRIFSGASRITIRDNIIRGDYSTANINSENSALNNVLIEGNLLVNGVGGNINTEPVIELLTGSTGVIRNNDIVTNVSTMASSIIADTTLWFENYYNEDADGSGTGALIGTVSGDD